MTALLILGLFILVIFLIGLNEERRR